MKKALVVVAHPDDETIWMGGTILKNRNWEWTIVSLCRKTDGDRAPKFSNVCKYYNAQSVIGDLNDESMEPLSILDVKNKIIELVPKKDYDYIFTHGKNGEYGHIRHREIHKAVKSLISERVLKCKKLFCFSYEPSNLSAYRHPSIRLALPVKKADYIVKLSDSVLLDKTRVVIEKYGFDVDSFEAVSCNKMEAFVTQ